MSFDTEIVQRLKVKFYFGAFTKLEWIRETVQQQARTSEPLAIVFNAFQ